MRKKAGSTETPARKPRPELQTTPAPARLRASVQAEKAEPEISITSPVIYLDTLDTSDPVEGWEFSEAVSNLMGVMPSEEETADALPDDLFVFPVGAHVSVPPHTGSGSWGAVIGPGQPGWYVVGVYRDPAKNDFTGAMGEFRAEDLIPHAGSEPVVRES